MDEAKAISLAQAGDQEAFHTLVDSYGKMLMATAYFIVHDYTLAQDAVQDALVQAWRGLPSYRTNGSFKAWLTRILINQITDQRRKKRVQAVPLEEAPVDTDDCNGIENEALKSEERAQVAEALKRLGAEFREAIVLRYYSDLTVPEIARTMGCREGTVKSRLNRGLRHLGRLLAREEE